MNINDNYIKALVTIISTNENGPAIFKPIRAVSLNGDRINLSVLINIETLEVDKDRFYLYLLYTSKDNNGKTQVAFASMTDFAMDVMDNSETIETECDIKKFDTVRFDNRILLKAIPTMGEGNYILVLSKMEKEVAKEGLENFLDSVLASYPFKVIK